MSSRQNTHVYFAGRAVALVFAFAGVATACGVDQGVVSLEASQTPLHTDTDTVESTDAEPDPEPAPLEPATPADDPPPTTSGSTVPDLPVIEEPVLSIDASLADVVEVGGTKPARAHDNFLAVALVDLQNWWTEVFPEVYGESFIPLEGGIHVGYPERESPLPGCGEPSTSYDELTLYVAFYCELGDFMIYDDGDGPESLLTPLANDLGPAVVGVVLAHEYGHLIQERIGALNQNFATIFTEQQADCFAGAWTGQAYRGESPNIQLGDNDVRAGLLAMLNVQDPVGTNQFEANGHGSAFDRVGAFQEGFVNGPGRCGQLLDEPLTLMPNEFQFQSDFDREGNASYDCADDPDPECTPAPEFLATDLNDFWKTALGTSYPTLSPAPVANIGSLSCTNQIQLALEVALCPDDDTVVFDEPAVLELYHEFGDFTLGYFYGIAWAERAQIQTDSPLTGEDRALLNDCLAGAWVRDITPSSQGTSGRDTSDVNSSPGDLGEAIQIAILVGDQGANANIVGSPFEKIESFRAGVLGGLAACELLTQG